MSSAILGKKLGITSYYSDNGTHIPCTVIAAGPCPVLQVKTKSNDGYDAVQVGYENILEKKINKPKNGLFKKTGVAPKRYLKEFRILSNDLKVGDELTVEQFKVGEKVKIVGTSKGKGFQGVVRRHHFSGVGMITHGQSDRVRAPGSIGSSSYPSRVFKGLRMAGRMGGTKSSIRNIEIIDILPEQNIIMVKGSVPGAINSLLEIVKK